MTSITVIKEDNRIIAFTCNGHAGYAKESEDIVCAAISMLVINTINSIEALTSTKPIVEAQQESGYIHCSFEEDITLIAGGYDKNLDYTPIANPIANKVNNLILLGETANKIYNSVSFQLKNSKKQTKMFKVNTLEEAVLKAKEVSKEGEVVLFSPASASFDMFKNFEERGNKYKELVLALE